MPGNHEQAKLDRPSGRPLVNKTEQKTVPPHKGLLFSLKEEGNADASDTDDT